jgi:hypothetical protein
MITSIEAKLSKSKCKPNTGKPHQSDVVQCKTMYYHKQLRQDFQSILTKLVTRCSFSDIQTNNMNIHVNTVGRSSDTN